MKSNYNPDVLNCLANLSSDEVFTPPKLVNEMLNLLPQELFSNPETKFLDPVCKTGVFLREIAKRLDKGLEHKIADKQKRIDHILSKQLFGIAITEITSLLARRSVYCSKKADGKYSICQSFNDVDGNIRFKNTNHKWKKDRCIYCGANKKNYKRSSDLETHAYEFIHTKTPQEIYKMKFDVIIGNPPYQLNDGGGTGSSAKPIYNLFIEQAKKLNPRYLCMIIPSRWYSGGKGLDSFRSEMLGDKRIRKLVDFEDSRDCFPGVDIAGGVCYFLWDRDNKGICEITSFRNGISDVSERYLDEFDNFIRDNISVNIIKKVTNKTSKYLDYIVSSRMPFGLAANNTGHNNGDLILISSSGESKISSDAISQGRVLINKWKVLLSKTASEHAGQPSKDGTKRVLSRIEVLPPNTICTESYLVAGSFDNKEESENLVFYLKTKFCRFMISTILLTQNITKGKFRFVPLLAMNTAWTDEMLYKRYDLLQEEIDFIESKIRPMENGDE